MTMENPYDASEDKELYNKLEALHGECIRPMYIETDGTIILEIKNLYDFGEKITAYVHENGITLSKHCLDDKDFTLSIQTLSQLASISAAYAAGYAVAREKYSQKANN